MNYSGKLTLLVIVCLARSRITHAKKYWKSIVVKLKDRSWIDKLIFEDRSIERDWWLIGITTAACSYKILIQHELKPADSAKRTKFCRWLRCYTCDDVSLFGTFFFGDEARVLSRWLHPCAELSCLEFGEPSCFSKKHCCIPRKLVFGVPWVANV